MIRRLSFIVFLFLSAPAMAQLPFDLTSADVRIMKGDSFSWRDPSFNDADWPKTELPSNWTASVYPGYKGICWYRIRFTIRGVPANVPVAVCLGKIRDNDEAYLNNIRIGETGKVGTSGIHAADRVRIYELPAHTLHQGENLIALRIESRLFDSGGIISGPFVIDEYGSLMRHHFAVSAVKMIFSSFFLTCGIFFIFYFIRRRKGPVYLLFGLLNLSCGFFFFTMADHYGVSPEQFSLIRKVRYIFLFASFSLSLAALTSFFNKRQSMLHLAFYAFSAVCIGIATASADPAVTQKILFYIFLPSCVIPLAMIIAMSARSAVKSGEGKVVCASAVLIAVCVACDTATTQFHVRIPHSNMPEIITPYGTFIFLGSITAIFVRRALLLGRLVDEKRILLEKSIRERDRVYTQLDLAYMEAVNRIATTAELRDPETENHIRRISSYTLLLAQELGKSREMTKNIFYASPMHDIGKVGIPDEILFKESLLSGDEWEIMKTHTTIGAKILENAASPVLKTAREIALSHHEKFDGSGYPLGLRGNDIPLSGRIMAIADTYDAIRSKRPFKEEIPHEETVSILLHGDGRVKPSDFDPELLAIFEKNSGEFDRIYEQYKD